MLRGSTFSAPNPQFFPLHSPCTPFYFQICSIFKLGRITPKATRPSCIMQEEADPRKRLPCHGTSFSTCNFPSFPPSALPMPRSVSPTQDDFVGSFSLPSAPCWLGAEPSWPPRLDSFNPKLLLLCLPQTLTHSFHATYSIELALFKGSSVGLWATQGQGSLCIPAV